MISQVEYDWVRVVREFAVVSENTVYLSCFIQKDSNSLSSHGIGI